MAKTRKTIVPEQEVPTFEQALERLEAIVHQLEDGQIGLEESLARYEEGVALLKRCYGILETAEQRVALLTGVDGDGNAVTEPFDATATPRRATVGVNRKAAAPTAPDTGASRGPEAASPEPEEENDTDAPRLF